MPDENTNGNGSEGAEGAEGTGSTEDTGAGSGEAQGGAEGRSEAEEVAKWKSLARKHEEASKKAARELDKIRQANQTEAEKAIEAARNEGRQAASAAFGERLASAEIKAALTGVVPDPAAIVEDLNLARYVTDDGEVDGEAVASLRKKYEGFARQGKPAPDLGQGQRGSAPAGKEQVTRADLARMTPEQIVAARKEGRLMDLARGVGR